MCGIAGIIAKDPALVRAALPKMVAVQTHRGPDDQGQEIFDLGGSWLGLGQRRLSILDLSPMGHQPMAHPETGDQIIFNGEIYNFQALRHELEAAGAKFRGHSDTEVLLHGLVRWGPEYISRLEGMYAFAFYKKSDGRLLLARDPVGIKPLYFSKPREALVFASEVRGILAAGLIDRKVDRQAVAGLLAYGSVPEPLTIYDSIRTFPAGCWRWFDARRLQDAEPLPPIRYWSFPEVNVQANESGAVCTLRETLDAAVRDHLVSDVPVGVFLSAGLDSTIMAALAAKHTPQLRTFTVGFADRPEMSEASLAAETARRIGTQHTDIQITGQEAEATARRWLDSLDQPSVDGLNTYVISQAVRAQGIVVALSGLGGDELFGGYSSFARVPRLMRLLGRVSWVPRSLRSAATSLATLGKPSAVQQKARDMAASNAGIVELFLQCRRSMSNGQLAALDVHAHELGLEPTFLPPDVMGSLRPQTDDVLAALSRLESTFYMGNTLLRDSDTNGMAHSLEIRVPLLDRRMLDFALALPGSVKLPTGVNNKHLLRTAFSEYLPSELTSRHKTGFTLPIGHWVAGPMRDLCESALRHLKGTGLLNRAGIDAVWSEYIRGTDRVHWTRPVTLCILGHYLQQVGL